MKAPTAPWLLLITHLPGQNATLRMRLWRTVKSTGAGLLRNGVYLLPNVDGSLGALEEKAAEIRSAGDLAHLLFFDAHSPEQTSQLIASFDRTAEYAEAIEKLDALKRSVAKLEEIEAWQRLAATHHKATTIVARHFFPGEP